MWTVNQTQLILCFHSVCGCVKVQVGCVTSCKDICVYNFSEKY